MKLNKIKFAALVSAVSRFTSYTINEDEASLMDELIDIDEPKRQYVPYQTVDELLAQIINPDGFIPAIKAYRALTGEGLKESKEAIERYRTIPSFRHNEPKEGATLGDILRTAK